MMVMMMMITSLTPDDNNDETESYVRALSSLKLQKREC